MGKFNIHGGTFAPKGFFRVNEGGSHESNPNGGVQVGMDEQGIPNMLEENEPVYKDFVYSDRIAADAAILEQFNIPAKFAGKLYSEIADAYVNEAEERPNDAVSNNGLNAMLIRLADAQEAQKQKEEEAKLQEEIEQMSPEELAMLDQMLAGDEQVPVEEQPVEEVPVMATGGPLLRKYGMGGPESDDASERAASIINAAIAEKNQKFIKQQEQTALAQAERKQKKDLRDAKRILKDMSREYNNSQKTLDAMTQEASEVYPDKIQDYQERLARQIKWVDYNKSRYELARDEYARLSAPQKKETEISFDDEPQAAQTKPVAKSVKGFEWLDDFAKKNNLKGCGGKIRKFPDGGYKPTWPMYAGVLGNAATALYNVFQPVTKYSFKPLQAQEPEGRMRQQHFRYNPVSLSLLKNAAAEQARGNIRAALASGAVPSTGGLLVAMDNNYTTAMGDAILKGIQANDTAYNTAIAHNNEADARQAAFDYQIDAAKKRARAEVDRINQMYDLRLQMMNDEAEQAKYNAIQVPLDNMLAGLAGIGRQNFAMNQVNSNPALLYGVTPNGVGIYKRACGGKLLKPYKK